MSFEEQSNPSRQFITALKEADKKIDAAIANLSVITLNDFDIALQKCIKLFAKLTSEQQQDIHQYWVQGVVMVFNTLKIYDAMPKMKITAATQILPVMKTNILNVLKISNEKPASVANETQSSIAQPAMSEPDAVKDETAGSDTISMENLSYYEKEEIDVNNILAMNIMLVDKIKLLSVNSDNLPEKQNLIDYVIANGTNLRNVLDCDSTVDEDGNTFQDFVDSDNNAHFSAIEQCLAKCKDNAGSIARYGAYLDKVAYALEIRQDLIELFDNLPDENGDEDEKDNFLKLAKAFIEKYARYQQNSEQYKREQNVIINNYNNCDCVSTDATYAGATVSAGQTVNNHGNYKKGTVGKVSKKLKIFGFVFLGISAVVFIISLIIALTVSNIGNIMLLISGLAELAGGIIVYKVGDHKVKYTCPECGTKRIHHRFYVTTKEQIKNYGGYQLKKYYTHVYNDTYECPNCGETMYCNGIQKNGGVYEVNSTGTVDKTIAPEEF